MEFDPEVTEAVALSLAFDQPANQSLHTLHYTTVAEVTEEARKCLTAAFGVLDEDGVPRVLRPWLEQVGWGSEADAAPGEDEDYFPLDLSEHRQQRIRGSVPVFRLRVPYQEEGKK